MIYKFDVFLDDKDYYEYNKFHLLRSPYGRRYKSLICFLFAAFALGAAALMVSTLGFVIEALIAVIPMIVLSALLMLVYPYLVILILKLHISVTKNSPKKNYSPKSTIEFYDESFAEETELNKTETKYFAIERISVTEHAIYMHMNSMTAYILPTSTFESDEELDAFIDFLKTKNDKIFVYARRKIC
ncbi:MAG: YcxB family protein [Clostridia bacterium]|nr:YcxB family protein [Clostridia bacterium]